MQIPCARPDRLVARALHGAQLAVFGVFDREPEAGLHLLGGIDVDGHPAALALDLGLEAEVDALTDAAEVIVEVLAGKGLAFDGDGAVYRKEKIDLW